MIKTPVESAEDGTRKVPYSAQCTGCHSHPTHLCGWDFPSRQPVFQNMVVHRHQLCHRQQRGQNQYVPRLLGTAQRSRFRRVCAKITIYNRRINKAEFEKSVLLPDKADGLDEYRHEFNKMLTAQVTGTSNSIVRERYLTVSVVKRNPDEARSYFSRVGTDLVTHLAQLSSVASELTLNERLHIFRDFFKAGGTGCGGVQYPRTRQARPAFQGLALPRQHGVCRRPLQD